MEIRHLYRFRKRMLFFSIMIALVACIPSGSKFSAFSEEFTKVRSEASYTEPSSTVVIHNVALRERLLAWIGRGFNPRPNTSDRTEAKEE